MRICIYAGREYSFGSIDGDGGRVPSDGATRDYPDTGPFTRSFMGALAFLMRSANWLPRRGSATTDNVVPRVIALIYYRARAIARDNARAAVNTLCNFRRITRRAEPRRNERFTFSSASWISLVHIYYSNVFNLSTW